MITILKFQKTHQTLVWVGRIWYRLYHTLYNLVYKYYQYRVILVIEYIRLSLLIIIDNRNTLVWISFVWGIIFKYFSRGIQITNFYFAIIRRTIYTNIPIDVVHTIIPLHINIPMELVSLKIVVITEKWHLPPFT